MTEPSGGLFELLDQAVSESMPEPPIQAVIVAGQRRRRRTHGAGAAIIAVVVAAIIIGSLALTGGSGGRTRPLIHRPSSAGPTAAQLAQGEWVRIASPPVRFCDPLVIPAGRRLIAINVGYVKCGPAAAMYDPATNSWQAIRTPGPEFYVGTHGVWTGGSLVLLSSTGVTARWRPSSNAWQQLGRLPEARPSQLAQDHSAAPGATDLVWTGSRVLANAITDTQAATYQLDGNGQWTALATFTEPAKGIVFDAPMAVDGRQLVALVATTRIHNNPNDTYTSGSVRLVRLSGDKWVPSGPVTDVPKSQLTLAPVAGGIAVIGAACPGEAVCTLELGEAAVVRSGQPTGRLRPPDSFPIPTDITAGSNAIVATYPDGPGSYGSLIDHAPKPGTTAIYDITASRWLSGPRAPHRAQELSAYWTAAGVIDLDTSGHGWLLQPAVATTTYPLPSDGWKPGDPSLLALTGGRLHAAVRGGQVCAWLGSTFRPMLWPAGYRVRLNPVELIAPDGHVVAHAGEMVGAGGGGNAAKPGTPCAQAGQWTFYINGTPAADSTR